MTQEKYIFQAELVRRLVEDEYGVDGDDMHHVFRVESDVDGRRIDKFIKAFEGLGYSTVVYTPDFEHQTEEEVEMVVRKLAPTVGLKVVEDDEP